jgi:twitching motility protein PilT
MVANPAIRNLIREGKTHQINSIIQTGGKFGMQTMDSSLAHLYNSGIISLDDAMVYASEPDSMVRLTGG